MDKTLKRLDPRARENFTLEALKEEPSQSIQPYINDNIRPRIDIYPLIALVEEAMRRFHDDRVSSDVWLGPRVHASLRLHRADATDTRIWDYLTYAVPELREYAYWRWKDASGAVARDRVTGLRRHAFSRLWWVAELMRNGPDYTTSAEALMNQDMIDQYMVRDFFHNRPAALAFVRKIGGIDEKTPGRRQIIRSLAESFNHILTTLVLDNLAPDSGPDSAQYGVWAAEEVDEALLLAEDPIGPNEDPVSEEQIHLIFDVLNNLLPDTVHSG